MKQPKRVRRSHEQWQEIVEQYQSSELSAPKFCAEHGISYASFSKVIRGQTYFIILRKKFVIIYTDAKTDTYSVRARVLSCDE